MPVRNRCHCIGTVFIGTRAVICLFVIGVTGVLVRGLIGFVDSIGRRLIGL
jgi:hypothetical protein